ncbi:MAG TPA: S8 family serine peptidase [Patescibacteria group bacterium]|nr:S8 family serine peptidase [Patescibacteria group bacterium]
MRRYAPVVRGVALLLALALLGTVSGRAARNGPSIDPLLRRMMRASEKAMKDHGRPDAISEGERRFFKNVASVGVDGAVPTVGVRLKLDDAARHAIEMLGIRTYGRMEGFASAVIPMSSLAEVSKLTGIQAMQAVVKPKLEVDVSRSEVRSFQTATTYSATGKGVILGNVDTGIDITHPDFRKADGTTRIKYLWRQDDACVGTPPAPPFDFGCLYTEADINASLTGGPAVPAPDAEGHGTQTTGIAAGNGFATGHGYPNGRYVGMSPDADIIMVKTFPEPGAACGANCFQISAGLDFIDAMAASLGKPYAINLSLGSQYGGHDGSDLDEQTIDSLIGPGIPGKAITKSVGNDRGLPIHISGTVAAGGTNTHTFTIPSYTPLAGTFNDYAAWWLWYNAGDNLTVTIGDPTTTACGSTMLTVSATTGQGQVFNNSNSGFMLIDDTDSPVIPGGARSFHMEVDDQANKAPCAGTWTVRVHGNTVPQGGHYDAWIWSSTFGVSQLEASWISPDLTKLISIPGTSFNVISVGGYMTKEQWLSVDTNTYHWQGTTLADVGTLAPFSTPGPTRDNRLKPEIAAPAWGVASALSHDVDVSPASGNQPFVVEDGVHIVGAGTSFSSPHVAGIFAQLLGLNPKLDAIQLRSLATSTGRVDVNVSPVPNGDWGYGKIDALAMADRVVKAIPDVKSNLLGVFSWTAIPTATTYNVYRGDLSLKSATYYGSCLQSALPSPSFSDSATPIVNAGFFYLVTGKKDGIEGILGFRSDGTPRPNNSACP